MNMTAAQPSIPGAPLFEALRGAGIEADQARAVESAIVGIVAQGQGVAGKGLLDRVMTKEDGYQMEHRLNQKIDQHLRWIITTIIAVAAVAVAAAKLL